MLSRRLIRIKTSHILYAYFKSEDASINKSERELFFSLNKSFELYHYLLLLLIDVKKYATSKIELARNKKMPTESDKNPNLKFLNNLVIKQIEDNETLQRYLTTNKISWVQYPELSKEIYLILLKSDFYEAYMANPSNIYEEDKNFVLSFYKYCLDGNEVLYQILEEKSIYWNDDVEFIINMIIKTIKNFKAENGNEQRLMQMFKNEDDREFAKNLFRKTILNHEEYIGLIESHTKNWDIERIAFVDILFMQMAIAEVLEFSSIPIKVTLNEYIEIIKYYSTQNSSTFINGILDKVVNTLQKENRIKKVGRGLIN